ncbi:MAG: hypothetical protein LH473_12745 [Chitinophagales bacterium]|nr:hypothetical protein [Chitinophagales bacterium]
MIIGENGCTALSVTLEESQQVNFDPYDAAKILGLDANSNLISMKDETDSLGLTHYRYYQTYEGIPIENSMYIMHSKGTLLLGMNGTIVLDFTLPAKIDTSNILSTDDALNDALNYVNTKKYMWDNEEMENELKEITDNKNATYYPINFLI